MLFLAEPTFHLNLISSHLIPCPINNTTVSTKNEMHIRSNMYVRLCKSIPFRSRSMSVDNGKFLIRRTLSHKQTTRVKVSERERETSPVSLFSPESFHSSDSIPLHKNHFNIRINNWCFTLGGHLAHFKNLRRREHSIAYNSLLFFWNSCGSCHFQTRPPKKYKKQRTKVVIENGLPFLPPPKSNEIEDGREERGRLHSKHNTYFPFSDFLYFLWWKWKVSIRPKWNSNFDT